MEIKITKRDVAYDQLNWSICLLVDYNAYIPAITLAAAAEEVLSKTLGEDSAQSLMRTKLSNLTKLSEKTVVDVHLNRTKNLFKHWPPELKETSIDLELEVIQYIVRAMSNMISFNGSIPDEATKFVRWLKKNHASLTESEFFVEWFKMIEIPPKA